MPVHFSKAPPNTLRIFCDFDGTIVPEDVGDAFFSHFAGQSALRDNALFRQGLIDAHEAFARYAAAIRGIDRRRVMEFCRPFAPRPCFARFVDWARASGIPITIISDGLDAYIESILGNAGLSLPVKANRLGYLPDHACRIATEFGDEHCKSCGTCKRNVMLSCSAEDDMIALIGNGMSDFCPARHADVVFATGELIDYCRRENISYRRFDSFDDVTRDLNEMLRGRRLRRPRRAMLARAEVWRGG